MRTLVLLSMFTLAAGYSDAVAFFGLGVFTANMTGNTVLLAGALAAPFVPHFPGMLRLDLPAISIVCFSLGAALAAIVLRRETGRPPVRTMAVAALGAALLVAAALVFSRTAGARLIPLCVALLSTVMGLQSVIAMRAGVPGISTTFVTGTIVTAILDFFGSTPRPEKRGEGVSNALTWALYLAGAFAGTLGLGELGNRALWPAAVVVALLIPVL